MNSAALRQAKAFVVASALISVACDHNTAAQGQPLRSRAALAAAPATATPTPAVLLLRAKFEPRTIHKIEIGQFHFTPGQVAPVHTHAAPALGYVSKGSIVYQLEGHPAQTLNAGDAFFEPVGPQIIHFDNASKSEEAIFTDFNFEQKGEPFIVFPTPPVNLQVDRRTLPTVEWPRGVRASAIDIYAQTLEPGASAQRSEKALPAVGYVADGSIVVRLPSGERPVEAGQSFDVPAALADVTFTNQSTSARAKLVLFEPAI